MKNLDLTESEWSDWIDGQDVLTKLHISARTLQRWRITGVLPYSRLNGRCYYRKSDIVALLRKYYNGEREEQDDE